MKELVEQYKKLALLIEKNKNEFIEDRVSVFNIGVGSDFKKDIVFYGRAVNGWCNFNKDDIFSNFNVIEENIKNDNLQWVIDLFNDPNEEWNPHRSAFWRLIKSISSEIYDDSSFEVINKIAWSNIYKVSKAAEKNPSQGLMNTQFDVVKEILKLELDIYQPKTAIFLTSLGWVNPFLKYVGVEYSVPMNTNKYVELIGKYNNTIKTRWRS